MLVCNGLEVGYLLLDHEIRGKSPLEANNILYFMIYDIIYSNLKLQNITFIMRRTV